MIGSRPYLGVMGNACCPRGAAGAIEMNRNPKRELVKRDVDELARRHQEQELDDALSNTFPASDPVSIVQPAPPKPDWD